MIVHFILYVRDQKSSTAFYSNVLQTRPCLDVPGMTEFQINDNCILGLMPEGGIKRLLGASLPDPSSASGIPRAELYLFTGNAAAFYERAVASGATPLDVVSPRDWGDSVGYCMDADGHVIAFAEKTE